MGRKGEMLDDCRKTDRAELQPSYAAVAGLVLPRIAIENTMPTLDGGQFAVKAVIGQDVVVTSKVFADGHDKLAVRVRWRAADDDAWQSEVMGELGNNGIKASSASSGPLCVLH